MNTRLLRVLVVDDEPKMRGAWERLLGTQRDMSCAGCLASADELLAALRDATPDVVLLDLTMPGRDPLEVLVEATEAHPDIRVVIYSGVNDRLTLRAAVDAGAWAIVDKLDEPHRILDVLRKVGAGETVLPEM